MHLTTLFLALSASAIQLSVGRVAQPRADDAQCTKTTVAIL